MKRQAWKIAGTAVVCALLGACAFIGEEGPRSTRPALYDGVWVERVALGSVFERDLAGPVEEELVHALGGALENPRSGAQVDWRGRGLELSSFQGTVRVGAPFLMGLDSAVAARLGAPLGLHTDSVVEPDNIPVRTTLKSNIRLGPEMTFKVATVVEAATPLTVKGIVQNSEWAIVTRGVHDLSEVIGYIKGSLLERADRPARRPIGNNELVGGEAFTLGGGQEAFDLDMALAGGVSRKPRMCRDFEQSLSVLLGDTHRWEGTACRIKPGHWEVIDRMELRRSQPKPQPRKPHQLENGAAG
jgi:surface antigen